MKSIKTIPKKSPKELRLICHPTWIHLQYNWLSVFSLSNKHFFFFFPGSGILNPFCWCFSVRFFFPNIRVCLLFLSLKLYVFIFTGKWFVFYLLVEKHIQKKNENLTILPVGFGDIKSQSVENKILSLTTSWSVNVKKRTKGENGVSLAVFTKFIIVHILRLQLDFLL